MRRLCFLCSALIVATLTQTAVLADNWPAWRGADGTGISREQGLPTEWTTSDNVRWKVPLPDQGNSTPIVWEDHVFLTQGVDAGKRRRLLALDRRTGKELWQREVSCDVKETTHRQNPPCSSSPVTDGESVFAYFASGGVVAYDFAGKELWKRDLGPVIHLFGNGGSPVIYKNLLILFHGPGDPSTLYALDKRTGKTVWTSQEVGINDNLFGSWGTPLVLPVDDHDELIMVLPGEKVGSPGWIKAYDPASGKVLWQCNGLGNEVYAMPIVGPGGDLIVGISGHNGPTMAVKPGGSGDVTDTHRVWRSETKNPQRIGTGIVDGKYLYIADAPGLVECLDARTGEVIWKERVGGNLWGSLLLADGKLYVSNLEGDTFVLRAGAKFELLSKNSIGETIYAAPAISNGHLFLRTHEHLYCIGTK